MKRLTLILLFFAVSARASDFTEFYVQPTGNNLNSGHTLDDAATFSATGGFWTNSTGKFKKAGMDLSGVTNGAWASVYPDAATTNVFTGLITDVSDADDLITVSLTAKSGTAPALDEAGATSIKVGGAWAGPSTNTAVVYANVFPFPFVAKTMTNLTGWSPCVNFLGTYYVTNAISTAEAGPITWSGYTNTPRDGGFAVIDGGAVGTAYNLVNLNAANHTFAHFILDHNGDSGTAGDYGLRIGTDSIIFRVVARNMRESGIAIAANDVSIVESEAYGNNISGAAGGAGITEQGAGGGLVLRCYSHDNNISDPDADGFAFYNTTAINCISDSNGGEGFEVIANIATRLINCDSYGNVGDGFELSTSTLNSRVFENCNAFKNTGYGINATGVGRNGLLLNMNFGSGTMANVAGIMPSTVTNAAQTGYIELGRMVYTADETPWTDPANGDFRPKTGSTAKAAGRGQFVQVTVNSPTNTVSYPDLGAAQSASTNAGSTTIIRRAIFTP